MLTLWRIWETGPWFGIILVLPYEYVLSSGVLGVLGNSTFTGQPLGESTSKRGREIAFFMMGEMGGGGGERSLEPSRGRSGVLRTCRRVREKKLSLFSEAVMESPSPLFPAPPWLLRKEVSPNTSPPRPTCMVWRKSPSGGLIMSGVRSPLKRRLPEEWDTRPFSPDSLPKFMTAEFSELTIKPQESTTKPPSISIPTKTLGVPVSFFVRPMQ